MCTARYRGFESHSLRHPLRQPPPRGRVIASRFGVSLALAPLGSVEVGPRGSVIDLLEPKSLAFAAFVASVLYIHLRGRVRFKFWRQLIDYSTFLAPYNALMFLFSGVPNDPIQDRRAFPELDPLRDNWKVIRDEAIALQADGRIQVSAKKEDIGFNSFFKRGWKRFYLKWYGDPLPSARSLCPRTVELLESVPSINAAMFTMMSPHSRLPTHRDPFGGSLRYHLGLVTPNDDACRIEIDGETYSWRDGEDIVWDETFVHKARNDTDEERIILFCDVARPMRTPVIRALNRFVTRHIVKATASRNDEENEPLGSVNLLASPIHAYRRTMRSWKKRNRAGYLAFSYAAKSAVALGVLYLFFGIA